MPYSTSKSRPVALYPLVALHLFLACGGLVGGALLIANPDGSLLGMDPSWLDESPFDGYLVPGLVLFTMNGVLPLITAFGLMFVPKWRWPRALSIHRDRHWSWSFSLYAGLGVIIWITVQLMMTKYFWLQPVMIFTGVLLLVFTLMPSVIDYGAES